MFYIIEKCFVSYTLRPSFQSTDKSGTQLRSPFKQDYLTFTPYVPFIKYGFFLRFAYRYTLYNSKLRDGIFYS